MIGRSLFFRLTILSGALIVVALALGGAALTWLFEREVERRAVYDLTQHLRTLAAQARIDGNKPVLDAPPADPRFNEPYSGLYWQLETASGERLRSRSLWDFSLPTEPAAPMAEAATVALRGPAGAELVGVTRYVLLQSASANGGLLITVALDRRDIVEARTSFLRFLVPSLAVLAALLIAAMAAFLLMALRPFRVLGAGLKAIHSGAMRTLPGRFPAEVQPIVDDLNGLIAFQDAAVTEARAHAGDLAHGLKTPLAVLGAVARDVGEAGQNEISKEIDEQVRAMDRHVMRALARARAGLVGRLGHRPVPVRPTLTKVVTTLARLAGERDIDWQMDIEGEPVFRGDPGDLSEMLGNVLDNAGKWAKGRVRVTAAAPQGRLSLRVEDDGPGMSDGEIRQLERGRRWDGSVGGSGFGLSIVRELTEAYAGTLTLERSALGGLSVSMIFDIPGAPRNGRSVTHGVDRPTADGV